MLIFSNRHHYLLLAEVQKYRWILDKWFQAEWILKILVYGNLNYKELIISKYIGIKRM